MQDEPGMGAGARRKGSHEVAGNICVSRIVYRRAFASSVVVKVYESHAGAKKMLLFQTKPCSRCVNPVYMQPENVVLSSSGNPCVSDSLSTCM